MRNVPTNKLLATTLRSIGDGVISCNRKGVIILMNLEAERLSGWTQVEVVGKPFQVVLQMIHEATRDTADDSISKVFRLKTAVSLATPTLLIRKDGTEIAIDDSAAPIIGEVGELQGVVLIFRDVTKRRRAEYNLAFLAGSGKILEEARDIVSILDQIGQLATQHFADLAIFDIRQPDGSVQRILGPHRVPELTIPTRPLATFVPDKADKTFPARVVAEQNGAVLISDIFEDILRAVSISQEHLIFLKAILKPRSVLIAPIEAESEHIGTVTFIRSHIASPFEELDRVVACELAGRLGLSLRYVRVREDSAIERARLQSIFESAPIGILVADTQGRLLSGNSELDCVLGHSLLQSDSGADIGQHFAMHPDGTLLSPEEHPLARACVQQEHVRNEELLYVQPDGSSRWISISGAPVKTPDGKLLGGVITVSNINEQKKAREDILRAERRFRLLLERASIGINISNEMGRLTYVNPALLKLIGYTKEDVERGDVRWDNLTPEGYAAGDQNALKQLQATGVAEPYEKAYLAKNGHLVPMLLGAAMIPSLSPAEGSEDTEDTAIFSTDLTMQKQAEAALLQAEKLAAVGKLASSIAHEINNPLEAVTNLLFIIGNDSSLSSQTKTYLEIANKELARVSQITTQTLRFHRQSTSAQQVQVESLLEETLELYASRLAHSNIAITQDYRFNLRLSCYEGEIRQILNNLIGNAFDAMRMGGHLTIRTRHSSRWSTSEKGVRVTITDTGVGISPERLGQIFNAFYTTKGINGTGLGLWISNNLANKHSGFLKVYSSIRQGRRGSMFMLWLPLQLAHVASGPWELGIAYPNQQCT